MKATKLSCLAFFLLLSQLAFSLSITSMVTEFPLNQEIGLAAVQNDCDRKSYTLDVGLEELIEIGQGNLAGSECTVEDYFNNILSKGDPRPHFEVVSTESRTEASYLGNFVFTEGQTIELEITLKNTLNVASPENAVLQASDLQGNDLALVKNYPVGVVQPQAQVSKTVRFTPAKESGVVFLIGKNFGLFQMAFFTYTVAGLGDKPSKVPPAFYRAPPSIKGLVEKGLIIELPLEEFQEPAAEIFSGGDEGSVEMVFEGSLPEEKGDFHGAKVGEEWQIIDNDALAGVENYSQGFNENMPGRKLSAKTNLNRMGRALVGRGDGVVVCGEEKDKCQAYQETFNSHVALSTNEFLTAGLQENAALTNGPYSIASIISFYFFKLISFLFGQA